MYPLWLRFAVPPLFVTTGLDPVVHAEVQFSMDCRVKPGNDEWRKTHSFGSISLALAMTGRRLARGFRLGALIGRLVGDAGLGERCHAGVAGERRAQDQQRRRRAGRFAEPHVEIEKRLSPSSSSSMRWPASAEAWPASACASVSVRSLSSGATAAVQTKPSSRTGMPWRRAASVAPRMAASSRPPSAAAISQRIVAGWRHGGRARGR